MLAPLLAAEVVLSGMVKGLSGEGGRGCRAGGAARQRFRCG